MYMGTSFIGPQCFTVSVTITGPSPVCGRSKKKNLYEQLLDKFVVAAVSEHKV